MAEKAKKVTAQFHTQLGDADNQTVNKWELIASRRALMNLKTLLGQAKLQELIQPEMDENDQNIHEYMEKSGDKFKDVFVTVDLQGMTATEYVTWQGQEMKNAILGNQADRDKVLHDVVFPAHPEHYLLLKSGIVETLGGLPTNATVSPQKTSEGLPQFVADATAADYPHKSFSTIKLADGLIWGYGVTEYKDTEDGSGSFRLHVWWPEAAPQIFLDDHNRHFAVEYRNFIRLAAKALGKDDTQISTAFHTQLGDADEATVDEWELIASRRALMNLKTLLGQAKLQELIQPEMDENDQNIHEYMEKSGDKFKDVFVTVDLQGMTATEYVTWQGQEMKNAILGDQADRDKVLHDVVFPAHPEHYLLLKSGIVETLGGLPTNATVSPSQTSEGLPQFVADATAADYPHKSFSTIKLADGLVWGYGVTEYKDTEEGGGSFRLHVWWPEAAPQIFLDDHNRHFAVEYRNFIQLATEAREK